VRQGEGKPNAPSANYRIGFNSHIDRICQVCGSREVETPLACRDYALRTFRRVGQGGIDEVDGDDQTSLLRYLACPHPDAFRQRVSKMEHGEQLSWKTRHEVDAAYASRQPCWRKTRGSDQSTQRQRAPSHTHAGHPRVVKQIAEKFQPKKIILIERGVSTHVS